MDVQPLTRQFRTAQDSKSSLKVPKEPRLQSVVAKPGGTGAA